MILEGLSKFGIVMIVITVILLIVAVALYFLGKNAEKKQAEQTAAMEANKQVVSMLVIDKKKVRFKDAGFPQSVVDQAPKLSRFMKVPAVKAKVGPQIITFIADEKIFDSIPIKKEVKATISGMYITGVKELRATKGPVEPPKKKGFFKKAVDKLQESTGAKPLENKKKK